MCIQVNSFLCKPQEKVSIIFFLFCPFVFLGPHPRHMEVPRLGVKWELQLPAYTTATATMDQSCVCDLHHSSRQCQILNPLSEARDGTCILTDTSWIRFLCAATGTPGTCSFRCFKCCGLNLHFLNDSKC